MDKKICFAEETYGVTINRRYLKFSKSRNKGYSIETKNIRWKSIANFFTTIFLPHGFPKSVSKDYLQYQMWDSIQAFASSITGSISTHAVLKGVGVGDENASPLAATITWLIKDGTSMVGRIMFAWLQGTKLDSDCKKWRLFADILNDMAIFLDLISAYFKEHFLVIICISGLIKSIVGVAGGATRAALTQHQARQNNMADVSAKDGSQETLVNLAALICSLVIIPTVIHNHVMIWLLYVMMTVIHLFSNYFAVKSVIMETFNVARFQIFMEHYLLSNMENVITIDEVNKRENVFVLPWTEPISVKLGASLNDVIEKTEDIQELINLYKDSDYVLNISHFSSKKAIINISLHHKSNVLTQIEAMYQAFILMNMISKQQKSQLWHLYESENMFYKGNEAQEITLVKFSRRLTQKNFSSFIKKIRECGWDTNAVVFGADMWRVKW